MPKLKKVDLIASGYEWICPRCEKMNHEIEFTKTVICRRTWKEEELNRQSKGNIPSREGCGAEFEANMPEHAYG